MTELVVTVPQAEQRWRRVVVAVVLVAAIVVAAALFWPTGDRSEPAHHLDIPQHLITEAQETRAAWAQVDRLIAQQQARYACRVARPC